MKPKACLRKAPGSTRYCAASLAAMWISALVALAGDNASSGDSFAIDKSGSSSEEKWVLVPTFSYSELSGRPSWEEYDAQLYYKVNPSLTLGGEVDVRHRPPAGTDVLYTAMASYYPWKPLELHGAVTITPDAQFSANQIYQAGFEVRPHSRFSLLFDYQHYEYDAGSIDQIKPGITFWFSDETFLTLRYASGWAFSDTHYDGFGGRFNLGLPGKRRLIFGYWHGTDPERDIDTPKTININADTFSLYYQQPLRRNVDLIIGVEYETLKDSYNRTTGSIGLAIKF